MLVHGASAKFGYANCALRCKSVTVTCLAWTLFPCRSAWVGRFCLAVCLFVRSITRKRMIPKCSNLVYGMILGYPRSGTVLGFINQRSKVKVTRSMTHNNTSFPTIQWRFFTFAGGDTSTITLQPRFIVIRYSLDGDTDNSNTAWVRSLWVQSSL